MFFKDEKRRARRKVRQRTPKCLKVRQDLRSFGTKKASVPQRLNLFMIIRASIDSVYARN